VDRLESIWADEICPFVFADYLKNVPYCHTGACLFETVQVLRAPKGRSNLTPNGPMKMTCGIASPLAPLGLAMTEKYF